MLIEVSDEGKMTGLINRGLQVKDWKPIGRITFDWAAASYNGDFVIHFHHPSWRNDRNVPASEPGPGKLGRLLRWVGGKISTLAGFSTKKS